jgi:hypothetical protein
MAYGRSATRRLFRWSSIRGGPGALRHADGAIRGARGASACRRRLARLARHEQGGGRSLRLQAFRHPRLAPLARLLSVVPARLLVEIQSGFDLADQHRDAAQPRADSVDPAGDPLHPLSQRRQGVRARHADRRLLQHRQRFFPAHHRQSRYGRAFREGVRPGRAFR